VAPDPEQPDAQPASTASSAASAANASPSDDAPGQARREPRARPAIEPSDIQGLKYFDTLKPLLSRLHDVGTARDTAGNRNLHMDQYCVLLLLWMFSPILTLASSAATGIRTR
jgi:hypothetical protein